MMRGGRWSPGFIHVRCAKACGAGGASFMHSMPGPLGTLAEAEVVAIAAGTGGASFAAWAEALSPRSSGLLGLRHWQH